MILSWSSSRGFACVLLTLAACKGDGGDESTQTDPGTSAASMTEGSATEGTPTEATATEATPTSEGGTEAGTTGAMSDPEIEALCADSFADGAKIVEAQCGCFVDQGLYPDVMTCILDSKGEGAATDACTCEVYSLFPQTKAGLECARPAQMTVAQCLAGISCTDDLVGYQACMEPYIEAIQGCEQPGKDVVAKVAIQCEMVAPFDCGSGEQIPETWKCDFSEDCGDLSDESSCPDSFMCADGTDYIPMDYKCDGEPDCMDMSDEAGCPTFMCMDGMTIPEKWKCDGSADCRDGSDEGSMAGCEVFTCMDGQEVPATSMCDGLPQCDDGSDEAGCPTFMCMNGEEIPEAWKCDGLPDCRDGSDEADCP